MLKERITEFCAQYCSKSSLIICVLTVAYLLPIWLFDYFPTQDGVSHVYNSQIITEYNNAEYEFSDYYDISWFPFPNWLSHISLTLLMFIFPPLAAEKVFLSIYVIFFPLAIRYFVNAVRPDRDSLVILCFTFIYNYLLLMGFYNFAVSVPLFFLALGYWWKHKDELSKAHIVLLNLLIITTYFAHLISYAFILFSIALLAVIHFKQNLKQILITGCSVLPAALMLLIYLPTSDLMAEGLPKIGLERIGELFENFVGMGVLIAYSKNQAWIAYTYFGFLLFLGIWSIWEYKKSSDENQTGQWSFLILFGVFFILYLILPGSIGPGGWVNDRLLILASFAIFGFYRLSNKHWWKQVFTGVVTLLAVANILYISILCKNLNTELQEFNAFVDKVDNNSVILPLQFVPRGESLKIGIFVNGANYYCLDNGCINLGNYEVQFDYFPIRFKPDFETPIDEKEWVQTVHWAAEKIDLCAYADKVDYLLLWGTPDKEKVAEEIDRCYTLIDTEGRLKLYKGQKQ